MKHSQVDVGDVELHVVELGVGRPVLFCHGFPDVWIGWRRQMEAVAAAGYRAIAVDMRGYDRISGAEEPTAYTPIHAIGDMVGLLDALDSAEAAIVGHDFGAATAWFAGLLRADRFKAVFGISVPFLPPGGPSLFEAMEAAGKHGFYMFRQREPEADLWWADAATSYPGVLHWTSASPPPEDRWDPFDAERDLWLPAPVPCPQWADPADIAYAVAEFERTGFHRPLNSYRSLQLFSDLGKAFEGVTVDQPSFFLGGAADGLAKVRAFDEATLRRDAPGLRGVAILPEVGHWPHREAAAATNELLVNFLGQAY
jgi:pimeloyl-ACP methyl ester carboxylesterase